MQAERDFVGRADVEGEPVDAELAEGLTATGAKADTQAAAHAFRTLQLWQLRQRQVGRVAKKPRAHQVDRPQRDRVRGAELAVRVLPARQLRDQRSAARHGEAAREVRVGGIDGQPRDHHRRHRREEVRVGRLQQVRDQARLLGIELELHARGEEGKAFEQPLDIRVGDLHALHAQPRGDLRKLAREFAAHLAQVGQLVAVEAQEAGVHGYLGSPVIRRHGDVVAKHFLGPYQYELHTQRLRHEHLGILRGQIRGAVRNGTYQVCVTGKEPKCGDEVNTVAPIDNVEPKFGLEHGPRLFQREVASAALSTANLLCAGAPAPVQQQPLAFADSGSGLTREAKCGPIGSDRRHVCLISSGPNAWVQWRSYGAAVWTAARTTGWATISAR